jgi:hypothetical protein
MLAEAERRQLTPADDQPQPPERAFAALDLDPAADADLVEVAYWYHVETCRALHVGTRAWRARMNALNEARIALSDHSMRPPAPVAAFVYPDRSRRAPWWLYVAAALLTVAAPLVVLVAVPGIAAARDITIPDGVLLAGALATAAAVGMLGWAAVALVTRRMTPRPMTDAEAHHCLRVAPTADPDLVTLAYRLVRRRAARYGDLAAMLALDEAYRCVQAAAARTPHQQQAAAPVDAGEAAPDDTGAVPEDDPYPLNPPGVPSPLPDAAAGAGGVPELRVMDGDRIVQTIQLRAEAVYTIGAGPDCDLRLPARAGQDGGAVAQEHVRLTVRRGKVLFHHVAAGSHSLVNGEPTVWAVLDPGDEIGVGPYVCRYSGDTADAEAASAGVRR